MDKTPGIVLLLTAFIALWNFSYFVKSFCNFSRLNKIMVLRRSCQLSCDPFQWCRQPGPCIRRQNSRYPNPSTWWLWLGWVSKSWSIDSKWRLSRSSEHGKEKWLNLDIKRMQSTTYVMMKTRKQLLQIEANVCFTGYARQRKLRLNESNQQELKWLAGRGLEKMKLNEPGHQNIESHVGNWPEKKKKKKNWMRQDDRN